MEADFSDEASENRLHKARVDNLDLEDEDEMPCSEEWRKEFWIHSSQSIDEKWGNNLPLFIWTGGLI
ncbi:MAG: hypothetical protein OXC82_09635 [Rhodobacteraceae bacterium]|nr:hypothetical protein [Paracoccaceae bacterium]MCY4250677.1 hypothetical protein [Paracoccaceae bacterium]